MTENTWAKTASKSSTSASSQATAEPTVVFQKLSEAEPVKFLKVAFHGQQKTGKTRNALTFPEPIYVILTEPGLKPLKKLFPTKEIYFIDAYVPDYTGVFDVDATKSLARVDAAVRQIRQLAVEKPGSVGTVVFDSVTDIWKWVQEWMKTEILKIDKTARVKQQWDWGYANTKYQNIIMQILSLPAHLVLTAQDKEEYSGPGSPSGEYTARWMNQTPYWVDIVIGLHKVSNPKTGIVQFVATVEDCRHMDEGMNPIVNEDIPDFTFDKLIQKLNGGKEAEQPTAKSE